MAFCAFQASASLPPTRVNILCLLWGSLGAGPELVRMGDSDKLVWSVLHGGKAV